MYSGAMHPFLHWFQAAAEARSVAEPHAVTYIDFLTVLLTALGVMLALLALIIAGLAFWGFTGIKESLTKEVRENADQALQKKLKEYPAAAEMIALKQRVDSVEAIHDQIMAAGPIPVAPASEQVQTMGEATSVEFRAEDYPPQIGS